MQRWLILIIFFPVLLTASPVEGEFSCNISASEDSEAKKSRFQFNASLRYQKKNLYIDFHPQANYSFNDQDSTEYTVSFLGEYYFDWGGISIHSGVGQSNNIYRKLAFVSAELFRTLEENRFILEYGSAISLGNYSEYSTFNHFDNTTYLIYKKFYRKYALHTNFDFGYRYLVNTLPNPFSIFRVSGTIFISRGLKRNIGLKYGINMNYVVSNIDSLLYPESDLYDLFAYNKYSLYLEGTMYFSDLLLKPGLSYVYKEYASSTQEAYPFTSHVLFTLYADYPVTKSVFIFTNDWFSFALNETENSYYASVGFRYIF